MASSSTNDHPFYLAQKKFSEIVKANTNGRVDIAVFQQLQLGGEVEVAEKIKLGAIEFGVITSSVFGTWIPEVNVIDLPFLFRDQAHVLASYPVLKDAFAAKFEAQGMHLIGFTLAGPRNLVSTFPVRTPDDVKGKKMRVVQNPIHIATWKALGANPTPLPFPEIYNAMQTGVVDYFDFIKAGYLAYKYYEVGKYFIELDHIWAMNVMVVSNAYWRRLSQADRDAIDKAGAEILPGIHQATLDFEDAALKKTVPFGAQVIPIADKAPWRQKMEPVWDMFIAGNADRRALIERIAKISP